MSEPQTLPADDLEKLLAPVNAKEFRIHESDRPDRMMRNSRSFNAVVRQKSLVCSLLAAIRFKLMGLGRKGYANATGIDRNTVKAIEKKNHEHTLHWRYTTIYNLVRHWEHQPDIVTPAHIQTVIDAILADRKETIEGLFFESEYRCGRGTIERDGKTTPDAVRAYRGTPYIPPFSHLKNIADAAGQRKQHIDIERMQRIWSDEARRILTEQREVPPALAELHVQAELQGSDVLSDAKRMFRNMRPSAETQIRRFRMPRWEEAEPIASQLVASEDLRAFKRQWNTEFAEESQRPDFHTRLSEIQDERGFSDHKMKRILGVSGTRPFVLMRDPVIDGRSDANTEAPPAVLAHILGRSPEETRELIALFRENRTLWRKRMGYPSFDHAVRLDREQWGITNGELASILNARNTKEDAAFWGDALPAFQALRSYRKKWPRRLLMLTENEQSTLRNVSDQGDDRTEYALRQHLRTVIEHLGMQRAQEAVERRDSYTAPQNIPEAITRMAEEAADGRTSDNHREFRQLRTLVQDMSPENGNMSILAYCTSFHMRRYADGIEVPSLPVLKHVLRAGGIENEKSIAALQEDWADRFAFQLQGKMHVPPELAEQYPAQHPVPKWIMEPQKHRPLSSALLHCIGRVGTSMTRFARDRMPLRSAADALTEVVKLLDQQTIDARGKEECERHLASILLAADATSGSPQWGWATLLLEHDQHTPVAFRQWKKRFPRLECRPWNLPGLTKADIARLQTEME